MDDDLGDLEALVSGVTQTSQSTLLLKKRKEMREVDDALEFMKEQCVRGWRLLPTAAVCFLVLPPHPPMFARCGLGWLSLAGMTHAWQTAGVGS